MTEDPSLGRQWGVLVDWNDDRGFGFIAPPGGGARAFVHVSAFPRGQRPVNGSLVTYSELHDERNRLRASEVRYLTDPPARRASTGRVIWAFAAATLFFIVLAGLVVLDKVPVLLLVSYVLLSGVAFLAYRADKSAAEQGAWRTPESTLHVIGAAGGWPGALVAQQILRHKTIKRSFRTTFWITVVANLAALALLVSLGL